MSAGPWEELRTTGALGPAGVALLYKTVRQVVRTRNLPPPAGEDAWTADALAEVAHEVFLGRESGRRGEARLLALATTSNDEQTFRSKLWTLVANDLVSFGRRSERGRIAERIKGLSSGSEIIAVDAGLVSRIGAERNAVSFDQVVAALSKVPVTVPAWDPMSTRAAPSVDKGSLEALVIAALEVAGALPLSHLVDAVSIRLQIQDLPDFFEVDEFDQRSPLPHVERQTEIDDAAIGLLGQMTVAQRLVVPFLNDSATETSTRTGLTRTRAWQCIRDVKALLSQELDGEPDAAHILRRATEIAVGWRET